ncbi:MAG: aminotransferase class I/II-fold pyridoxal phosphate-dependent enzyme [Lachnospiraceae bacterium]|nr:aminotransferase class I/II-fold pyridoxal phosphate-dependent enzyme [Lachnospiraceae bacterium]MBQ3602105.1 aminotransferase class I/II-fold pyridoxal phosphate-dependent enzyme [Lachnospiraceae bacterium]
MDTKQITCSYKETIRGAMQCIESNSKKVIFCIDEEGVLVGILTDGDIRRLLLNGYGMNESIENHINRNCIYAFQNESPEEILKKFNSTVTIIPILDYRHHVVDYAEYDEGMHISLAQPQLNGNEYQYLMDAFLSTWISSSGKYVTKFEESFASYCGMKYGVATSNGTAALHLALLALDIGEGDEVIVPNLTFAATINAVLYTGATPVIVDIEEESWCISPEEIEYALTDKTKAIIPVHIYGQPCDMEKICDIAQKHNLYIIEDCAEAHGACFDGKKVGSFGDISCFSFFGNKVITTGEGGMCLTNNSELNEKMRKYRDHGMSKEKRYYHEVVGYNYRMTNLQAAIGTAQIERIDSILSWRKEVEDNYRTSLSWVEGIQLQKNDMEKREKITWLVSILIQPEKREKVMECLKKHDIDVRAFFYPLDTMDIYSKYARKECSVSHKIAKMGINLPTTYNIDEAVIDKIRECLCMIE